MQLLSRLAALVMAYLLCAILPSLAADYPEPRQGDRVASDFGFLTGEVPPEVKVQYREIGLPPNKAVLMLHGTTDMANFHKQQVAELLQQAPRR